MTDDIKKLFSPDGLIHPAHDCMCEPKKQTLEKKLLRDSSLDDAEVCLNCTWDSCDGEKNCFKKRNYILKQKKIWEEKQFFPTIKK